MPAESRSSGRRYFRFMDNLPGPGIGSGVKGDAPFSSVLSFSGRRQNAGKFTLSCFMCFFQNVAISSFVAWVIVEIITHDFPLQLIAEKIKADEKWLLFEVLCGILRDVILLCHISLSFSQDSTSTFQCWHLSVKKRHFCFCYKKLTITPFLSFCFNLQYIQSEADIFLSVKPRQIPSDVLSCSEW